MFLRSHDNDQWESSKYFIVVIWCKVCMTDKKNAKDSEVQQMGLFSLLGDNEKCND